MSEHRLVFEAFGVVAEAYTDDADLFGILPALLPPGWRPARSEARARFGMTRDGLITRDRTRVFRIRDDREDLAARFGAVVRQYVALHAPDHVFVHAGVVGDGNAAIVLPGRSHSGKTTLVAELLTLGATYYSDEYAVVDSLGRIEPYPKPLSVREDGAAGLGAPVPVPAGQVATNPARAGVIAVTRYVAGATWRPKSLSSGEAVLELLRHTVPARARPGQALEAVSNLARGASVLSGRRGDVGAIADELLALLRSRCGS